MYSREICKISKNTFFYRTPSAAGSEVSLNNKQNRVYDSELRNFHLNLFFCFQKESSGGVLWKRCFPVNFAKFLRTPFSQNTSGRLLLALVNQTASRVIWNEMTSHCIYTAWKVSKFGVISAPYFPIVGLNTGKYRPEITPYLSTFHAVL